MGAELADVAITTFATDADRLAEHLVDGIVPLLRRAAAGDTALVSAVSFRLRHVRLGRLALPWLDCGHVDYRAYVLRDGEPAVWFLGAAMASRMATLLRRVWAMPWHRAEVEVSAASPYVLRVGNGLADVELVATRDGDPTIGTLDGFTSAADAHAVLVNPTVGLFASRRGLRRYEVRHEPLVAAPMTPEKVRVELFERLGLITSGQAPHSVLAVPDFRIEVQLPPWPA